MAQTNNAKRKIVISGYYGFDNIGDEAVLYGILKALRIKVGEQAEVTVLSANPARTQGLYGVQAVDRWDKKVLYRTIKQCDLLISGGGSLLQDVTSANSPLYYLGIIKLAQLMKKPVVIYAQGIGPLKRKRNRWLTKCILNKATAITVRDNASAEELKRMGIKRIINVTADPVLGIGPEEVDKELGQNILQDLGFDFEKKTAMVALRNWKTNDFVAPIAKCCNLLAENGWQILLVPMQWEQDHTVLEQTQEAMQQQALLWHSFCSLRHRIPKKTSAFISTVPAAQLRQAWQFMIQCSM